MSDEKMLGAAMAFVAQGWPVFPCNGEKKPLTQKGFKSASIEPPTVRRWWDAHPEAMIGVPTGAALGLFVLDINPPMTVGLTSCEQCRAMIETAIGVPLPKTRVTFTPKGWHVWFHVPEGVEIRNRGPLLKGAIDCVRGTGGYVIAPPSRNSAGEHYMWADKSVDFADAPAQLIDLVVTK